MEGTMPILLQKDNTFTKLFVGGLPYTTNDETLKAFFLQYGDIEEAVVIKDRSTGNSMGYGFVTMVDKDGAERACSVPNPMIDGRKANVNLAYLGAKRKTRSQPGSPLNIGVIGSTDHSSLQFPAQQSPPPPHLALQANGFFLPPIPPPGFGYDSGAPFSPPPMLHPFFYSYYFNPHFANGAGNSSPGGYNQPPPHSLNFPLPHSQMPPLVPYNTAN